MDDDLRGMCPRVCSRRASVFEEAVSVPTVDPKTGKTTLLPQSKVLRPERRADQCLSAPGLPTMLSGRCHAKRRVVVGTGAAVADVEAMEKQEEEEEEAVVVVVEEEEEEEEDRI
nr:unnamed protein product [Spirometra erinaceieuropaei]